MKVRKGFEELKERPWLMPLLGDHGFKVAVRPHDPRYRRHLLRWLDGKVEFIAVRDFLRLDLNAGPYHKEGAEFVHPLIPSTRETCFFRVELFVFYHLGEEPLCQHNVEVGRCREVEEPRHSRVDSNTILNVMRRVTKFYQWSPLGQGKTLCWDVVVVKTSLGTWRGGTHAERFEIYPFPEGYKYQPAAPK